MADIGEVYGQMGAALGTMLTDRAHKHRFEQFQQNEFAEYQQSVQGALQAVQDNPDDPDAGAQAFLTLKSASFNLMTSAGKFADNPYIAKLSNDTLAMMNDGLAQFMTAEEAGEERADRPAAKARAEEDRRAALKLSGSKAEEATAHAGYWRRMPQAKGGAGGDGYPFMFTQGAGGNAAIAQTLLSRTESKFQKARLEEEGLVRADLAQQRLSSYRGQDKPGMMGGKWGDDPEADLKSISANEVTSEAVSHEWMKRRLIKEGWNLSDPGFGGRYKDIEEKSREIGPLPAGLQTIKNIGTRLLGTVSFDMATEGLEEKEIRRLTPTQIVKNLPNEWQDLDIDGPIPNMLATASTGINPVTGKGFKNWGELMGYLGGIAEGETQKAIGGFNIPDRQLQGPTRKNRVKSRELIKKMITKYAFQIARDLDLPGIPAEPTQYWFPKGTSLLAGEKAVRESAADMKKQVLRLLEVGETED